MRLIGFDYRIDIKDGVGGYIRVYCLYYEFGFSYILGITKPIFIK